MNLNLKELNKVLPCLPVPCKENSPFYLQVVNRIDSLRASDLCECLSAGSAVNEQSYTYKSVRFEAVEYCRGKHNCWYEWEMVVE